MSLPTFFIVGSPKCGTTALAQMLAAHPDVFLSKPKEPHFFDAHHDKGLEPYMEQHFAGWSGAGVAGEATPSYLAVPYVPARIRSAIPAARLIAILRNPVQRAYSSWWMFHARGMEPLSFEAALRANEVRLSDSKSSAVEELDWRAHIEAVSRGEPIRIRNYLDSGYYSHHIRRYLEHFPREQLKVVLSHDLQRDPETTVREVWRHLGVADDVPFTGSRAINEAIGAGARPLLAIASAAGVMRLRRVMPDSLKDRVKKRLSAIGKQPPLDPAMRAYLLQHYAPHNRDLEQLLGFELSAWKR
jgi:Sulfotransferase domain